MRKFVAVLLVACVAAAFSLGFQAGKDAPAPEEDKLFVWASPDKGQQSMLVLKVIDAETVEAAYLVPVVVVLKKNPDLTKEAIDEVAGGRLLAFDLRGRDRFGRVQADVWLGKDVGWLSKHKPKAEKKK